MPPPGQDPGPFLSLLDWLNTAGEVPLNIARGRPGAAGRKALDFLGDIPDAILPGDWIPDASTEEDAVSASEVLGIDPMRNPAGAKVADIIGGTVANPLSYLGLRSGTVKAGVPFREGVAIPGVSSLVDRTKDLARAGWEKLPEGVTEPLEQTAKATGRGIRRTFNWLDVPEEGQELMGRASGAGAIASKAATERTRQIYETLTGPEREIVGEIAHGIARGGSKDRQAWKLMEEAGDLDAYIASQGGRVDVVKEAVKARNDLMDTMMSEGISGGAYKAGPKANDAYIKRMLTGEYFDDVDIVDRPLAARKKELKTSADLLRFMKEEPTADLEFNAMVADAKRAANQGRVIEKATAGKLLTKKSDFNMQEPGDQAAVESAIEQLKRTPGQEDYAYKLENIWKGTAPRSKNAFAQALHQGNKLFKGAATFGILLPRVGFSVRNRIGGLWQALSDDVARGKSLGESSKRALSDLMGAFDDGFVALTNGKKGRLTGSELTKSLDYIENAFKQSGGSANKVREILAAHPNKETGQMLLDALDHRVLDDFISSEQLISEMARTPAKQRTMDILTWPAAIARGVEQRMRLGTFMDLRKGKIEAPAAAKTVRDTYLDYSVPGWENRTFRDIIPFGAFLSQNVKQQSKFLAAQPSVAVAASQLYGQDDGLPKYPWLEQQMALPTGLDEEGNAQYLTSFGLPIEGMTAIPGFGGNDLYRDVVGSMQPLLKTGIAYAVDKDPFTGREFGEYDKIMGQEAGKLGRAYNILMGTGLTQAFATPMGQLTSLADERKHIAEKATQFISGIRFTSVDPDLAERQQLEDYLKTRPDIRTAPTYYQTGEDDELTQVLKDLRDAKARLKEKRAAASAM